MALLYHLISSFYKTFLWVAAHFNGKARAALSGRKAEANRLKECPPAKANWIWVHASSLGEFEQGRPLIEELKRKYPDYRVLLSFFSPSGFEVRKGYEGADLVTYLPLDSPRNARRWLNQFRPVLALFIKYDFWYFYLRELHSRDIPVCLVSGLFREGQVFFRWYGKPYRKLLHYFDRLFVQNDPSLRLLRSIGLDGRARVTGDTRIDRVLQIAERAPALPEVDAFCGKQPVLVAGSTWPADESRLFPVLTERIALGWKAIIAPHEIADEHISAILDHFQGQAIRYSSLEHLDPERHQVLVIDNIGMLSRLYRYARIAYIGGGFGAGIHNTLEPIAFRIPVLFGPRFSKFEEARYLFQQGGGFPIHQADEIRLTLDRLDEPKFYREACQKAGEYLDQNKGATQRVLEGISAYLHGDSRKI